MNSAHYQRACYNIGHKQASLGGKLNEKARPLACFFIQPVKQIARLHRLKMGILVKHPSNKKARQRASISGVRNGRRRKEERRRTQYISARACRLGTRAGLPRQSRLE